TDVSSCRDEGFDLVRYPIKISTTANMPPIAYPQKQVYKGLVSLTFFPLCTSLSQCFHNLVPSAFLRYATIVNFKLQTTTLSHMQPPREGSQETGRGSRMPNVSPPHRGATGRTGRHYR